MTSMRVNADYESVLFNGKPAPGINQVIEFLLFYLDNSPLNSSKKYDPAYLDYVASITGRRPVIVNTKDAVNWWGPLKDPELERWWNSKVTSQFLNDDSCIVNTEAELTQLNSSVQYLLKDPFGMSGQRIQLFNPAETKNLKFPILAEPFFDRDSDFSHYVFPDGKVIAYENLVDRRFQYKGSVFNCLASPDVDKFSFYSELRQTQWLNFSQKLVQIRDFYQRHPNLAGYSIDSFTYREAGELKIRAISEVNYRRTMGRCAYELGLNQGYKEWFGYFLLKPGKSPLWKMEELRDFATVLSPGDSRFEMLTIAATDAKTAKEKIKEINELLANAETTIDF